MTHNMKQQSNLASWCPLLFMIYHVTLWQTIRNNLSCCVIIICKHCSVSHSFIRLWWPTMVYFVLPQSWSETAGLMSLNSSLIVLTVGSCNWMCLFSDLQTALYELCWHVIQGNIKVDVAASLLADVMVSAPSSKHFTWHLNSMLKSETEAERALNDLHGGLLIKSKCFCIITHLCERPVDQFYVMLYVMLN